MKKLKLWLDDDRHFRWVLLLLDLITVGMCAAWMAVLLRVLEVAK